MFVQNIIDRYSVYNRYELVRMRQHYLTSTLFWSVLVGKVKYFGAVQTETKTKLLAADACDPKINTAARR